MCLPPCHCEDPERSEGDVANPEPLSIQSCRFIPLILFAYIEEDTAGTVTQEAFLCLSFYSLLSFSYRSLASFAPSANNAFAFSGKVRFNEA